MANTAWCASCSVGRTGGTATESRSRKGGTALYRYDGSWDRAVLLGSSPFKAQAGARYRVRIEVDDFHFRVYAGDELIITASDLGRRYSEGYTGIKIGNFVRTTAITT